MVKSSKIVRNQYFGTKVKKFADKSPLEIAELYDVAQHAPNDSHTRNAYETFWYETYGQFLELERQGWQFIPSEDNPYATYAELCADAKQGRLRVFTGGDLPSDHPLARGIDVRPELVNRNWVFRCVHDIAGHWMSQNTFQTFEGELGAWRNHQRYYSRDAHAALFTETVAQLCWTYQIGKLERFADQKAVIL